MTKWVKNSIFFVFENVLYAYEKETKYVDDSYYSSNSLNILIGIVTFISTLLKHRDVQ